MGEILAYAIQSTIFMTGLYLIYKWLLSAETFHAFNRGIILAIYVISLAAPALLPIFNHQTASAPISTPVDITSFMIPVTVIDNPVETTPIWLRTVLYIYLAGVVVMTARLIYTGFRIAGLIRSGEKITTKAYTIVITEESETAPFSWGHYVVMNRNDYTSAENAITTHEAKHIACRHWIDLLAAEIVQIFNWFSPAAWLLKEEMRTIHEYQADMAVISSGTDPRTYQMLLIKKAVGSRFPSLANSLNHSKLKKRINMMLQTRSKKRNIWRAVALLPAIATIIILIHQPVIASVIDEIDAGSLSSDRIPDSNLQSTTIIDPLTKTDSIADYTTEWNKVAVVGTSTQAKETGKIDVQVNLNGNEDAYIIAATGIEPKQIEQIVIDHTGQKPVATITLNETESDAMVESIAHNDKQADIQLTGTGAFINGKVLNIDRKASPDSIRYSFPASGGQETARSTPAIFVDNVRMESDDLRHIDPSTIASITVIKDKDEYPEGAIYVTLKP